MNDLLDLALTAHGGRDRWNAFTALRAEVSIGGAIWEFKQQPGLLTDKVFAIATHRQSVVITPFTALDRRCVFQPHSLVLEGLDGTLIETRENPEGAFAGQTATSPWDKFHVAYFASEALWTYLTSPFLYASPGFVTEEIEPWEEDGETWRRLKVTFPDHIFSHGRTQVTHFGPDGLMRRHDYTVDILEGASGANYPSDYVEVQGLMLPSKRGIYAYDGAGRKVPEPLLVSLDFGAMTFS
ncbi:hypothetical protein [Phenylobacterium sp.]|uniref:hypothetical protein n=1 Tax=Phenylobacterium sp. TaxID=1871053 RepID=UPI001201F489|nr:hypothetical protein [Phenylobacterium sp.]THD50534.1 MAG: hypothetical protein E8A12_22375 [Phenylobacterium sp.]